MIFLICGLVVLLIFMGIAQVFTGVEKPDSGQNEVCGHCEYNYK